MMGKKSKENVPIVVTNVYLSCSWNEKREVWPKIVHLKGTKACKALCMLGDYNVVMNAEKRKGISERRKTRKFNHFIDNVRKMLV